MTFRSICVYAGSNVGTDPAYALAAEALGRLLAEREIELVYGGGRAGLMGVVADAALTAGGRVVGITPHRFVEIEVIHTGLTELVVVDSMHQRKAAMAERSDAFIALPGGLGTVEELVEAATWTQLGIHAKPIGLLDAGGFWEPFDAFLEHCVATQFVRAEHRRAIVRHAEPEALLDALAAWRPVEVPKVLELDES